MVDFQPADLREIVGFRIEEQTLGRMVAASIVGGSRAQPLVNLDQRFFFRRHFVDEQGVAQVGADRQTVEENDGELVIPASRARSKI